MVVLTVVFMRVAVVGMELGEMGRVRPVIERFAGEMFADLPRRDQRGKGELYVQRLLTDGKRKSMVPMAARLGVDPQQLQQFVTSSTWDYRQVRRRLTGWAAGFCDPVALVVDDTGFPEGRAASPGVARMYSGTLGKVGNCQIGVSVHAVTDWASAAVAWRLFLPTCWDDTTLTDPTEVAAARARERAAIPDKARHREKWRLVLDMIDELAGWGMPVRPVVADAGYGDAAAFRQGLTDRNIPYVLAVKPTATAYPADAVPVTAPYPGNSRRPTPAYPDPPRDLKSLVMAAGRRTGRSVTWRHGTHRTPANPTAGMRSRFLALRVRPAGRNITRNPDRSLPVCWLLAEWPVGQPEPTDYWLSTLPTGIPLRDLVRLAKIRWRIEHDYRELKDGLGLDHFEGRTFAGWHRHVTLVRVAQALCTQLRRTPKVPAPA
ncbi:transposase, IS4 family [Frankia casuarinae]|uniref:Transposase, IS4 family n=6 Tax=Frankia TaxID=1854 RepID=Q2J569_FRACC|nr:IS701 family transposase [Frankia casuarinae]ABD13573.1 transposase, IS4 family [Frankia casuarinae]